MFEDHPLGRHMPWWLKLRLRFVKTQKIYEPPYKEDVGGTIYYKFYKGQYYILNVVLNKFL
jgi:hypothetical protein